MSEFIDRFHSELPQGCESERVNLEEFIAWMESRREAKFVPDALDDADIRSYLLHLKLNDTPPENLHRVVDSIKRFYSWARDARLIGESPFDEFNFERPLLSPVEIRRRTIGDSAHPVRGEIARLRAVNLLAVELNRTVDIHALLSTVVKSLTDVMRLSTAWIFLWKDSELLSAIDSTRSSHDLLPVACCGLPVGLEKDDRTHLTSAPDCRCQQLLRDGRLVRAVNVVECTRLQRAAKGGGDTGGLLYHASVPLLGRDRSFGLINVATETWELLTASDLQFLSAAAAQVSAALERAQLHQLVCIQKAKLEEELAVARLLQQSLLPKKLPQIARHSLAAICQSARQMAGDFYDVFLLRDGRWAILIADVSGKGAPAAFYMAMVRSLIRMEVEHQASPADALAAVNRRLLAESCTGMFVTVFYVVIDPETGVATFCNAGHDPPLVRDSSGRVIRLPYGGHLLGMLPQVSLSDERLELDSGSSLVMFTDGVIDSLNVRSQYYGLDRLSAAVRDGPRSAGALLSHLVGALSSFCGDAEPQDDVTFLILSRD